MIEPVQSPLQLQPQAQQIYVVQQPPRGFSVASMVLGLCSIPLGVTFVIPLCALIFGIVGLKKEPAGKGMAVTGIVIGAIFMFLWALVIFGPLLLVAISGLYVMLTGAAA